VHKSEKKEVCGQPKSETRARTRAMAAEVGREHRQSRAKWAAALAAALCPSSLSCRGADRAVIFPLCTLRRISALGFSSALAVAAVLFMVCMMTHEFTDGAHKAVGQTVYIRENSEAVLSIPLICFALHAVPHPRCSLLTATTVRGYGLWVQCMVCHEQKNGSLGCIYKDVLFSTANTMKPTNERLAGLETALSCSLVATVHPQDTTSAVLSSGPDRHQ
jgi:hypothetical protein